MNIGGCEDKCQLISHKNIAQICYEKEVGSGGGLVVGCEVPGSIPAPSEPFSRETAILKFVQSVCLEKEHTIKDNLRYVALKSLGKI